MSAAMLLALVGVLAMAVGLLVGRYYVPDNRQLRRAARRADVYARALNHVLDGEHDPAVGLLRRVVEEDTGDIEPYFALGALFRARGEWERAIRVHQAIPLREPRNKHLRLRALHALAQDFRRAGMPRRATRALEQCLDVDGKHAGALASVAVLYEEQGRYQEAADALARLDRLQGRASSLRVHHLLVAAAQRAMRGDRADLGEAKRLLRDARRVRERSVHALVAEAELAAARRDPKAASARLVEAMDLAPELAAFLLPGLLEAQRQIVVSGREPPGSEASVHERAAEGAGALVAGVAHEDRPFLRLALAELRSHFDPEQALRDYRDIAERFPDLLPAQVSAARLALASGDSDEILDELRRLTGADGALAWAVEGAWRCSGCGHRQDLFFWRCRSCRAWGSVRLELGRDALPPLLAPPWEEPVPQRGGVVTALVAADAVRRALPAAAAAAAESAAGEAGEAPGSSRRASLWSRMGAWFTGLGSGEAGEGETETETGARDALRAAVAGELPPAGGSGAADTVPEADADAAPEEAAATGTEDGSVRIGRASEEERAAARTAAKTEADPDDLPLDPASHTREQPES